MQSVFLKQRSAAEFIATFWFVFGGCGSAVLEEYSRSKEDVREFVAVRKLVDGRK